MIEPPIWKICAFVKLDHLFRDGGEHKNYLKPPASSNLFGKFTRLSCTHWAIWNHANEHLNLIFLSGICNPQTFKGWGWVSIFARVDQLLILGMVIPPLVGNPYNKLVYKTLRNWVDDHPPTGKQWEFGPQHIPIGSMYGIFAYNWLIFMVFM